MLETQKNRQVSSVRIASFFHLWVHPHIVSDILKNNAQMRLSFSKKMHLPTIFFLLFFVSFYGVTSSKSERIRKQTRITHKKKRSLRKQTRITEKKNARINNCKKKHRWALYSFFFFRHSFVGIHDFLVMQRKKFNLSGWKNCLVANGTHEFGTFCKLVDVAEKKNDNSCTKSLW